MLLVQRNHPGTESKRCQEGEDWASDRKTAKSEAEARVRKLSRAPMTAAGEQTLAIRVISISSWLPPQPRSQTARFLMRSQRTCVSWSSPTLQRETICLFSVQSSAGARTYSFPWKRFWNGCKNRAPAALTPFTISEG